MKKEENKPHVVIVGAGMSGLAAAYTLAQTKKYRITLVEKHDRVGGRTYTKYINGYSHDMGGFIIYPWYKTFHYLIKKLRLEHTLSPLPRIPIFYKLSPNSPLFSGENVPISLKTKGMLAAKLLPTLINNVHVASPNLSVYKGTSIREFLQNTTPKIHDSLLERYITTICEGYCYPDITRYQSAFMFPMMGSNLFFGDITTASFFPKGISTVTQALFHELTKANARILLNTPVHHVSPAGVHTETTHIAADYTIITHPLQDTIPYTRFITLTLACDTEPTLKDTSSWGALFLHRSICKNIAILSAIHTGILYGPSFAKTITLNIALKKGEKTPMPSKEYTKRILAELKPFFPTITKGTITALTHWEHTMPQSNEKIVQNILAQQGKDGIFFAGDFLGCPSIETAVTTGIAAAEKIIQATKI